MSSTSSSDQGSQKRSAADFLASRYRHLFVLPSAQTLLFYSGIATLFLSLASRGTNGFVPFLPAIVVLVLSVSAISSALLLVDKRTIATFRRTNAALLAGIILWLLCAVSGAAYSQFSGSSQPLTNGMVFGAFVAWGLEFLIINGAFTNRTPLALVLGAMHPASTLVILRFTELVHSLDFTSVVLGATAFAIMAAYLSLLKRRKTSLGHDALTLFQAFMKTWANGDSTDLEPIISAQSEDAQVTTKVLRFQTAAGDIFLLLPGIHPGPFHPVGSYDLPGVFSREFKDLGPVMTLHRPGGHESNLSTKAETTKYAAEVKTFAGGIRTSAGAALIKGPTHSKIGNANVTATAFSRDLLLTISFAPLGSDDLSPEIEGRFSGPASAAGFDASIVDAHNSIDPRQQAPDMANAGWAQLFTQMKQAQPTSFRIGYANSVEVGFKGEEDLTENGIGVLMVESNLGKSVLVLADANNAAAPLRAETSKELEASGYRLIELCTSDTHNLAARGLTVARGYEALGEATPMKSIAIAIVDLAKLAETRLSPSRYGSGELTSNVRVLGSKALEEFAGVTLASSKLGGAYFRFASVSTAVLLLLSLLL